LRRISAIPLMPIPPIPMKCACWEVANMRVRKIRVAGAGRRGWAAG
jgi:hypothetical protein